MELLLVSWRVGWSWLGIWVGHHVSTPRYWRLAGPPVRHSSNHYSRGEEYQVGSSGSQLFSLRDRYGEQGAPLGPHAWDQSLSSAHSSRLTSCVQSSCEALAVPTSCVVSKKKRRSASSHQATSIFYKKRNLQHLCRSPLALVFLHLGPHALLFHVLLVSWNKGDTLLPCWLSWRQCSCVLQGLVQMTTLFAVW